MTQFKVGDRVAAYDDSTRFTGRVTDAYPFVYVQVDHKPNDPPKRFCKQQVRRLKPKAKLREFWLEFRGLEGSKTMCKVWWFDPHSSLVTHVREVRKK